MDLFDNTLINATIGILLFGILLYAMWKYRTKHAQSREIEKSGTTVKQAVAGLEEIRKKEKKERAGEKAV